MTGFSDAMTLGEARALLRELVDDGHECPCCRQFAKVYKRKISGKVARDLIRLYRRCGLEPGYLPDVLGAAGYGDFAKLRYWGLIAEVETRREDSSDRGGWWRVTPAGRDWILRRATVRKYVRVYAQKSLGFRGGDVSIDDALGTRFRYDELMAGA